MSAVRVLHVGKFYPPSRGGMEKVVQVLCEAERTFVRDRVDSQVLVANDGPRGRSTIRETVQGVPITRSAVWKRVGSVAVSPAFPWWMRRLQHDVMVVHEPNPVGIVAHALARPSSRLIVWIHAEVVRPQWRYNAFYRPFLRRLLARADHIVVASPPMADLVAELRDFKHKLLVIPYAIDPDQHALTPDICERARAIRAGGRQPLVLFVGRLVPYKGVDVLLRALPDVKARAILVGDGPMKAEWQRLAADLGLTGAEGRVEFAGEVDTDTLAALYQACDVFVLPSVTRAEAFGMVQVEAMACRKPVISTALPSGVPWVNQHGETGLVVPPGDVMALKNALNTLVSDPDLRARMGERGRARVEREFSTERMAGQAATMYESAVGAERAPEPSRVPLGKRLLDIVLSGIGLVVSSPVWLGLAAAITLEDRGPVFYTQDRVGEGGRLFKVFKFRSMIVNAEAAVGALQATEHDPRVTAATAMDELPQLWNIFRGDMSFVGPRALRPGEIEETGGDLVPLEDIPGYADRCRLRPGLTGVAQIYAPRDVGRRNKFRFDRVYAKRESFWLDVRLILVSFWITFRGRWEHRGQKV